MHSIDTLAEQHIRESQSHLLHIDELMKRAMQRSATGPASSEAQGLHIGTPAAQAKLEQELDVLREGFEGHAGHDAVSRIVGLNDALQSIGSEFERALTAFLDCRGMDANASVNDEAR